MTDPSDPVPPAALLRGAGLRVTSARSAIIEALRGEQHQSAEQVAARVRERVGSVSTQAVYEALGALTEAGLLRRIEPMGRAARYETRVGDNHHHLVCRSCGAVADVDCAVGHAPCLEPVHAAGFAVDEADVVYWGTCPACQESAREPITSA
ncbi:Fur family transcriptional regulator [Streptomyces polyrhachis]|uniref:Fur family transcriptional regulator n=1 Tax=Streptomyces polyrhachis TaxID=1282885 RepID=A0ABW2GKJ5_9ACTN